MTPLAPVLPAVSFPVIDPVALAIGPFAVRWYALAYIAGLVGGYLYARRLAANAALWPPNARRPDADELADLLVFCALGLIAGGRLAYVVFYNPAYFLAHPLEIPQLWKGGMSFHGGLLGGLAGAMLFARRRGLAPLPLLDLAAAVAPLGLLFGRIANFVNAELWGRVTDVPWGVVFPNAGPLPRHPSQLYEAATEGLLLLVLLGLAVRAGAFRRPGLVAGLFAVGYGVFRIACELFREPDPQLGFLFGGGLTMGMLLSLPLIAAGAWLALRARPAPNPSAGARAA